jgi:hypothetical protein
MAATWRKRRRLRSRREPFVEQSISPSTCENGRRKRAIGIITDNLTLAASARPCEQDGSSPNQVLVEREAAGAARKFDRRVDAVDTVCNLVDVRPRLRIRDDHGQPPPA